jgi:hypothetical protein
MVSYTTMPFEYSSYPLPDQVYDMNEALYTCYSDDRFPCEWVERPSYRVQIVLKMKKSLFCWMIE